MIHFFQEYGRLSEGFSIAIKSPNSSSPDIFWSSSGSSDIDIILRSHAHHRVVTRLDFDSCVVRSPDACRQLRARVSRNVINVESRDSFLHHPAVSPSEHSCGQMSRDAVVASNVNPQVEMKREDSESLICSDRKFSGNVVHNFNVPSEKGFFLQESPDHISGTGNASSAIESSLIIGNKTISQRERYFHDRNSWRKRRMRKVNGCFQPSQLWQEHATSRLIDFCKSGRKGSYQSYRDIEAKHELRNNLMPTTVDTSLSHKIAENETSPVTTPQQNETPQGSVISPVMKCRRIFRKQRHSVDISHLEKNCFNITNKSYQGTLQVNDNELREGGAAEDTSTNLITSPSSPILGKSREKKFRRRKYMRTVKSKVCIQNKGDCCNVVSRKGSPLHGHSIEITSQQEHVHFVFNNIDDPGTAEEDRKTKVDNRLEESQNCTNCDASGVDVKDYCVINEDVNVSKAPKCSDEKTCFSLFLTEADATVEKYCNITDIEKNINSPSLDSGKVVSGDEQCGRKSVSNMTKVLFSDVQSNVSCGRESLLSKSSENMCNSGEREEEGGDDVTSTEQLIESGMSQDISMDTAAVCHHNDLPQVSTYQREVQIASCRYSIVSLLYRGRITKTPI